MYPNAAATIAFAKNSVVPAAIAKWQSLLFVQRVTTPLLAARPCLETSGA
jgi:hypothetical protein